MSRILLILRMMTNDSLHREIKAIVTGAVIAEEMKKAWVLALVTYDSKACGDHGGPGGGGEDDCGDDGDSCGGDDEGGGHDGGCDGGDSDHQNVTLSGRQCRIGQIMAIKAHDGGTPGTNGDGITWKWFMANGQNVPHIESVNQWPHLCQKLILGGNLVVH